MNERGIIKKELVFIGIIFLVFVFSWTVYDNYNYFNNIQIIPQAQGATSPSRGASLSVVVGESITFTIDAGGNISFGTLTAGTPVTSTTRLKTTTNSASGFSFTAAAWSYITEVTFYSNIDRTKTISDVGTGRSTTNLFDGLGSCAAGAHPSEWGTGTSTGFGLTVYSAGISRALATSPKDETCWGLHGVGNATANNKYGYVVNSAGSPSSIFSSSGFSNSAMYVSVGYILDVDSTQAGTKYQAAIEYIATSNP